MDVKENIEALKEHLGNYGKVADTLGISSRHLLGLRKGRNKASVPLERYISDLAKRLTARKRPNNGETRPTGQHSGRA